MKINNLTERFITLKSSSGTHSPSIDVLLRELDINIRVDACFLSNPYATELFLNNFNKDLHNKNFIKNLVEHYPPQNRDIAKYLASFLNVNPENIFIGNGAIEIIQAILQTFVTGKIIIPIPTFSSYYEFVDLNTTEVVFYNLSESSNFLLDIDDFIKTIKSENINNVVLINPNNPNGAYTTQSDVIKLLDSLYDVDNIIIDQSFIHFAYEDTNLEFINLDDLVYKYRNLTIIKSMSKDFGIAGLRCGYAITKNRYISELLRNGYLWNVNGFSNYFFKLYTDSDFQTEYELCRKKYIMNTMYFYEELSKIPQLKVYPSKANFFLIKVPQNQDSTTFMINLLCNHGIYVRDCNDKVGLSNNYVRIASRNFEENIIMIESIKKHIDNVCQ